MKKLILLVTIIFCFFACKKDNKGQQTRTISDKIILNQVEIISNNSVKLTWSKLDPGLFDEYLIQREIDLPPNGNAQKTLARITDKTITTYEDTDVPYKQTVRYFILGSKSSGFPIVSNKVIYSRPSASELTIKPLDVLFNKENNILYLIENNGTISLYDIATDTITKILNTGATIGYSDIATYNGKTELYVPRNDGWVFVYDAVTLEKITQLSTGTNQSSVVSRSNLLYVSAYNYGNNQPIKVINRNTGITISQGNKEDMRRLKYIPNSNNEFLAISPSSYQQTYRFTPEGQFIDIVYRPFSNYQFYADAKMLEFFPDGSKYIATQNGELINRDMTFNRKLTTNNLTFSTYAFSASQLSIYAGTTNKTVEAYDINNFNHLKSYRISGTPFKIFDLGTQLLCISMLGESWNFTGIAIEKINK